MMLAEFALLEPCFCCLSENALVLSLENRRLFLSLLLDTLELMMAAIVVLEAELLGPIRSY